jgi:hypothetical protein
VRAGQLVEAAVRLLAPAEPPGPVRVRAAGLAEVERVHVRDFGAERRDPNEPHLPTNPDASAVVAAREAATLHLLARAHRFEGGLALGLLGGAQLVELA